MKKLDFIIITLGDDNVGIHPAEISVSVSIDDTELDADQLDTLKIEMKRTLKAVYDLGMPCEVWEIEEYKKAFEGVGEF
jgi:hypothetical protein